MTFILQQETYRPAVKPADNLPFGVRSAGHYKIQPPFTSFDRIIAFVQLFWCARGNGIMEFAGKKRVLKQNQAALYYPNMRHHWHADQQDWEFYWLTIDGPFAASMTAAFGLEADVYDAGAAPVDLFKKLQRLVGQTTKQAELRASAIAFNILTRAAGSHADQTDELVNTAVKHMHEQCALPTLNVKTLISELGIRRAAFTGRFHAAMGMTPGAYLERLRLQNALTLLKQKQLTIAEVAAHCGYTDANYFSRVIRRTTGRSPLKFRKHYLSGN
jgi:AraC-like DNA-binding protein